MNDKEMKREKKTREIILLAFHKSSSCRPSQFAATKGFSPYLWYIFVNSQRNMKEGSLLQFKRGIVFWWIDSMLIYRIHQYGFCQQGTLIIKPMTKKEFLEIENLITTVDKSFFDTYYSGNKCWKSETLQKMKLRESFC